MRKLIGKGGDQMEQLSNKIRQKGGAPVLVSTHDYFFLCSQPSCCPVALLCSALGLRWKTTDKVANRQRDNTALPLITGVLFFRLHFG